MVVVLALAQQVLLALAQQVLLVLAQQVLLVLVQQVPGEHQPELVQLQGALQQLAYVASEAAAVVRRCRHCPLRLVGEEAVARRQSCRANHHVVEDVPISL